MKLLFFAVLIFIFFISCKQDKTKSSLQQDAKELVFSAENTEQKYQLLNPDEKIRYLSDLVSKPYKNSADLDEWIFNKLVKEQRFLDNMSPAILKNFTRKINEGNLIKSSRLLSNYILAKANDEQYKSLQAIALKSILDDLRPKAIKDSIKYYLDFYERAIAYDNDSIYKYDYYCVMSTYNELNGDIFKAILNLDKALTFLSDDDNKNKSVLYNNLSLLYKSLNYYEKAEYYIEKAISITNESQLQLNTLNSLASIKMRLNKLEESESIYKKILEKSRIDNNQIMLAQVYTNLGNVFRRKKEFDKALDYYHMSDSISDSLGMDIGKFINQINRSEVYLDMGQYKEAEQAILLAQKLSDKFNIPNFNVELFKLLSEIFEKNDKTALSDKYFRMYIQQKEKLGGDQTKSYITEWELAKERERNLAINAEIKLKVERKSNQLYFISLLLLVVLVSGIALYLFQKKKNVESQARLEKEKQKMSYELELKSKTLLADSLKSLTISSTKEVIFTELKKLIEELPKSHQSKFTKLLLDLKSETNTSFLDEFETRFTGVYDEFFDKLNKISSEISPTELKLCALMKLNLSTKEIAVLTNRTVGTIDNARSSIRKKLNLDDSSNLQQFLIEL